MRRKLIAGNWKMNGSLVANQDLIGAVGAGLPVAHCAVALCVPSPYLAQAQALLAGSGIDLGAQDLSCHESGALTGEISAALLREWWLTAQALAEPAVDAAAGSPALQQSSF